MPATRGYPPAVAYPVTALAPSAAVIRICGRLGTASRRWHTTGSHGRSKSPGSRNRPPIALLEASAPQCLFRIGPTPKLPRQPRTRDHAPTSAVVIPTWSKLGIASRRWHTTGSRGCSKSPGSRNRPPIALLEASASSDEPTHQLVFYPAVHQFIVSILSSILCLTDLRVSQTSLQLSWHQPD
jgi:hypothetical protein